MTERELDYRLAVEVMGWTLNNYETSEEGDLGVWLAEASRNDGWDWLGRDGDKEAWQWSPTTSAEDSKAVRDKLAEKYDYLLGSGKTRPEEPQFGFALYRKPYKADAAPMFEAEADTELKAVALCALQCAGRG